MKGNVDFNFNITAQNKTRDVPSTRRVAAPSATFLDDDCMDSDEYEQYLETFPKKRLDVDSRRKSKRSQLPSVGIPQRNPPILPPKVLLDNVGHKGMNIRPRITVELQDGSFIRVTHVIQDVATMEVVLRGRLFGRTRAMNGLLGNKMNEVCMLMQVDKDDLRGPEEQSLEEVSINNVIKRRRLRLTNQPFPDLSFRINDQINNQIERDIVEKERVLVCRWQYICYFVNARARLKNSSCETALLRLRKEHCDTDCEVEDDDIRTSWRGLTIKGGSANATKTLMSKVANSVKSIFGPCLLKSVNPNETVTMGAQVACQSEHVDLTEPDVLETKHPSTLRTSKSFQSVPSRKSRHRYNGVRRHFTHAQMYSHGDAFCGAGGASRGATMAHLKVCWGFDMNENACESWSLNWPEARLYKMMANEFALDPTINAVVDIMHISSPCQPFSPAHTRAGPNDEMNTASSFVIFDLLDKAKPRIVTIENTFGLPQRHKDCLNGIIHQFTSKGFSVRWKIMHFSDYGLPQSRQRLVIIASWQDISKFSSIQKQ